MPYESGGDAPSSQGYLKEKGRCPVTGRANLSNIYKQKTNIRVKIQVFFVFKPNFGFNEYYR